MANHEALKEQLSLLTVIPIDRLEDLFGICSLRKMSLKRNTSKSQLIFCESSRLVTKDVVYAAELFR
jgi:hypothetical protein